MRVENHSGYIKRREADAITPGVIEELKRNPHKGDTIVLVEKEVSEDGSRSKIKRTRWQIVELYKYHMFLRRKVKGGTIQRSIDYPGYLAMNKQ